MYQKHTLFSTENIWESKKSNKWGKIPKCGENPDGFGSRSGVCGSWWNGAKSAPLSGVLCLGGIIYRGKFPRVIRAHFERYEKRDPGTNWKKKSVARGIRATAKRKAPFRGAFFLSVFFIRIRSCLTECRLDLRLFPKCRFYYLIPENHGQPGNCSK